MGFLLASLGLLNLFLAIVVFGKVRGRGAARARCGKGLGARRPGKRVLHAAHWRRTRARLSLRTLRVHESTRVRS